MAESEINRAQVIQEFADAYERLIAAAQEAAQRGMTGGVNQWGPREVVAHLAGWEVMATVRLPAIAAGLAPLEFDDPAQLDVLDDAINATISTMIGDQPLAALVDILRRAYQCGAAFLETLDDEQFQPGKYIYDRTIGVREHCEEHMRVFEK